MINYDDVTKENINKHYLNWPDRPYRILIIGGSGSVKTNGLLNLIKQQNDDYYSIIGKIYLFVKNPYEAKYQYLFKNVIKNGLENLKDPKAYEYSNNMQDAYKQIEESNQNRKYYVLIVLDDMIADMIRNKKLKKTKVIKSVTYWRKKTKY